MIISLDKEGSVKLKLRISAKALATIAKVIIAFLATAVTIFKLIEMWLK